MIIPPVVEATEAFRERNDKLPNTILVSPDFDKKLLALNKDMWNITTTTCAGGTLGGLLKIVVVPHLPQPFIVCLI